MACLRLWCPQFPPSIAFCDAVLPHLPETQGPIALHPNVWAYGAFSGMANTLLPQPILCFLSRNRSQGSMLQAHRCRIPPALPPPSPRNHALGWEWLLQSKTFGDTICCSRRE